MAKPASPFRVAGFCLSVCLFKGLWFERANIFQIVDNQFFTRFLNRLVAVEAFCDGKALFPTGFVKFFAEYARFRLQNLPNQSKK
jgi:hypothetical protein